MHRSSRGSDRDRVRTLPSAPPQHGKHGRRRRHQRHETEHPIQRHPFHDFIQRRRHDRDADPRGHRNAGSETNRPLRNPRHRDDRQGKGSADDQRHREVVDPVRGWCATHQRPQCQPGRNGQPIDKTDQDAPHLATGPRLVAASRGTGSGRVTVECPRNRSADRPAQAETDTYPEQGQQQHPVLCAPDHYVADHRAPFPLGRRHPSSPIGRAIHSLNPSRACRCDVLGLSRAAEGGVCRVSTVSEVEITP